MSMEGWPESFEVGWNPSFRTEILVNGEDTYYVQVRKHILIPWIQIKPCKKEAEAHVDTPANSNG